MTGKLSQTPDGRRISFAQNGEDIVLLRVFGSQPTGVWVDAGANHLVAASDRNGVMNCGTRTCRWCG